MIKNILKVYINATCTIQKKRETAGGHGDSELQKKKFHSDIQDTRGESRISGLWGSYLYRYGEFTFCCFYLIFIPCHLKKCGVLYYKIKKLRSSVRPSVRQCNVVTLRRAFFNQFSSNLL